jgi:GNAT superfamily N-acetyltransferase
VIEVRRVAWDDPDGVALREAQQAEVSARYGVDDSEPGPTPTAADMTLFLVAFDGEEPVGCGGLRALDATHGEVKRMYVVPARRGTGVSTAILRRLEEEARALGWERLLLETGTEQPDAMRFYEREGFARIPNYGHYVDSEISRCYAKAL